MELTGKTKETFLKHSIGKEIALFEAMLPIYQHALIIEWLDSVGYHIGIEPHIGGGADVYYAKVIYRMPNFIDTWEDVKNTHYSPEELYFSTRQQATEKAIERAVELFNERSER